LTCCALEAVAGEDEEPGVEDEDHRRGLQQVADGAAVGRRRAIEEAVEGREEAVQEPVHGCREQQADDRADGEDRERIAPRDER